MVKYSRQKYKKSPVYKKKGPHSRRKYKKKVHHSSRQYKKKYIYSPSYSSSELSDDDDAYNSDVDVDVSTSNTSDSEYSDNESKSKSKSKSMYHSDSELDAYVVNNKKARKQLPLKQQSATSSPYKRRTSPRRTSPRLRPQSHSSKQQDFRRRSSSRRKFRKQLKRNSRINK